MSMQINPSSSHEKNHMSESQYEDRQGSVNIFSLEPGVLVLIVGAQHLYQSTICLHACASN